MKIIITESQYSDLKFRRIYRKIQSEFEDKLDIYIPCNYNYEGGEYDFFMDVQHVTIESVIARLFDMYVDDENEDYQKLYGRLSDMLYETEFESVKEYYNDWIKEHCPKKDF
jgi:hypothetical protein